jgi:hypothetical protein
MKRLAAESFFAGDWHLSRVFLIVAIDHFLLQLGRRS